MLGDTLKFKRTQIRDNANRMRKLADGRRSDLVRAPTKAEIEFRGILKSLAIAHKFQTTVYTPSRFFIVDFETIPNPKTIFEIDGGIHEQQRGYDEQRTILLLSTKRYRRFTLVRLTNAQVFNGAALELLQDRFAKHLKTMADVGKIQGK